MLSKLEIHLLDLLEGLLPVLLSLYELDILPDVELMLHRTGLRVLLYDL